MKLLAFDLDGTLDIFGGLVTPEKIKSAVSSGYFIMVVTFRDDTDITDAREYCKLYDIYMHDWICGNSSIELHYNIADWKTKLLEYVKKEYPNMESYTYVADQYLDEESANLAGWEFIYAYKF